MSSISGSTGPAESVAVARQLGRSWPVALVTGVVDATFGVLIVILKALLHLTRPMPARTPDRRPGPAAVAFTTNAVAQAVRAG